MTTPTANGGFVITTGTNNITGRVTVDDNVLRAIVEALGIPKIAPNIFNNESAIRGVRSIYIYRGQ